MKTIKIKPKAEKKIKAGYPLIHKEDLMTPSETDEWVRFVNQHNQPLGVGYLGEQHKGQGWVMQTTDTTVTEETFIHLFKQAILKRESYFNQRDLTNAFRLFNGEGDGLGGIIIDYYDDYLVISWYNKTIYQHKKMILAALKQAYPDFKGLYEKRRFQTNESESQFIEGNQAPEPLLIRENGVQYATYLDEGLMTGIFLDQKEVRGRLVDGFFGGMTVLNMFSYTGAFSVAAAMGGALKTVSVDLAKRSLAKTTENFVINGLNPDDHEIRVMDVFDYVRWAVKKGLQFDAIILDPPSFARNGRKTFSVAKDYGKLVQSVLPLLKEDGYLIASTNAANVSKEKYEAMIQSAFKSEKRFGQRILFDQLPSDFAVNPHFKEGNYLKVITYQVK